MSSSIAEFLDSLRNPAPQPGWSPPRSDHAHEGDCMRRACACIIGVHPNDIPWIEPRQPGGLIQFYGRYTHELSRLGFELSPIFYALRGREAQAWKDFARPDGFWIGIVAAGRNHHAVVFDGDRYHFGAQHRTRHPNKLFGAWTIRKAFA